MKNILLESICLDILKNIKSLRNMSIVDKEEIDITKLEFLTNTNYELVLSYDIKEKKDTCQYYLIIVIEKDRILYLVLDTDYNVVIEEIVKEEEVYDYIN